MNHYPRHIGDWIKKTAHLTLLEQGVYGALLDWYYDAEQPLPADTAKIFRRLRATTASEKAAVQAVLDEFFTLDDSGWHQSRCDEEIAKYQANAEKNRGNGKSGGRPKKPKDTPEETQEKPTGLFSETQTKGNQNQEPEPLKQKPVCDLGATPLPDQPAEPGPYSVELPPDFPDRHTLETHHVMAGKSMPSDQHLQAQLTLFRLHYEDQVMPLARWYSKLMAWLMRSPEKHFENTPAHQHARRQSPTERGDQLNQDWLDEQRLRETGTGG